MCDIVPTLIGYSPNALLRQRCHGVRCSFGVLGVLGGILNFRLVRRCMLYCLDGGVSAHTVRPRNGLTTERTYYSHRAIPRLSYLAHPTDLYVYVRTRIYVACRRRGGQFEHEFVISVASSSDFA